MKLLAAVLLVVTTAVVGIVAPSSVPTVSAACDRSTLSAAQLNQAFAAPNLGATSSVAGYAGGDYPHAYPLPDRRVLWLFQDVFFSNDDDLHDSLTAAAHNAGLVQDGSCFTIFGGPGRNAIGHAQTTPLNRWYWPLDGELGADGALWIFMAEITNPGGNGAGLGALPSATWIARLDPDSLEVLSFAPAPDRSAGLYGWSVVSDDHWSYLFGHCYRQYAHDVNGPGQFDSSCMPNANLARVPLGHFEQQPQYWNGSEWTADAAAAQPVLRRGYANPMSVQWFGDTFVSVSKVSDWWGSTIEIDRATSPTGPWQTAQSINVVGARKCSDCGNYGAFLMPWLDTAGQMTIALSNGGPFERWYSNAALYRPTFYAAAVPTRSTSGTAATTPIFPVVAGTAGFEAVDPERLVDTREPGAAFGRLAAGTVSTLDLRGLMPPGTTAVALNLAATASATDGWVRAYPCNGPVPTTSSINPTAGSTISNAAVVPVGDGRICLQTLGDTDLVVDLDGWLTTRSDVGLVPTTPKRVVDTRLGQGGTRLESGRTIEVEVVPPGSPTTAVALNVTAVDPGPAGFVTAWPCGTQRPVVANLTPQPGITRPNLVNVRVGSGGKVCLYSMQATDLVVDLFGEYRPGASARYGVVSPTRLLDSRDGFALRHASDLSFALPVGDVAAVQLNVTATGPSADGYLTSFSCMNGQRPLAANVNYRVADTAGNAVLAPTGRGYTCVFPFASTDVVVDLFGVWTTAR